MKKVIVGIILFVLIILGIFYVKNLDYDEFEIPEEVVINLNNNEFPVYEKHMSYELLKDYNVEIISSNKILENEKIGEYNYTLEYKYKKRKYKYYIPYKIVDITPPVFISAPKTLKIEASDSKELCSKIVYADNYDSLPSCKIVGEYEKTVIGTYDNLEYIISDGTGNEEKKNFTLSVVNKIPVSYATPNYNYLYMNDILNRYKNDNTSIGIDVSKWQGNVDFKAVKDAGVEFVIMRIGSQRHAGDSFDVDSRFDEYYKAVKEVGLKVGVYIYNVAISPQEGKETAKWVIDKLNGDKLDFPVAYDFEDWQEFMNFKISLHTLSESYKAFRDELKKNGYEAMLYSSKFYLENVWMDYEDENIWLAHYTDQTDYKGKYMMWQMTSMAKINGITENTVDVDILYK